MLSRLGKTLSTNAAIGGLALLVLGAGGTTATLAAGNSPSPTPNSHANTKATDHASEDADEADDATDNESEDAGTRPTDTHGYCVSQVAKAETTSDEPGAHGAAVKAAAQSCGGTSRPATAGSKASTHRQNGTHGKPSTTGRPATAGAAAQR